MSPSARTDVIVVGSYVQDLTFYAQDFPAPGESRIGRFVTGPGGKGFNQAIACHRLGVSTFFLGAVGNDVFAEGVREFARSEHLPANFVERSGLATGAASVVVNERGENMIVVALGANEALRLADVSGEAARFKDARVVLCQVESNLEATRFALESGRQNGALTILNPAPINEGLERSLLEHTDILVPNETEFAFLMQHLFDERLDEAYWKLPGEALHEICGRVGVPTVVITLGERGCFVSHHRTSGPHHFLDAGAQEWLALPAANVQPLDTTGAGDAFNGGLAAGLVRYQADIAEAAEFANRVAGLSTTRAGTAPAMPSAKEVDALVSAPRLL